MLPERYRRLLKRRLRRRPLLPFLLAATVAVDLAIAVAGDLGIAITWRAGGFVWAQFGLLAIWGVSSRRWLAQRLSIATLAAALLALIISPGFNGSLPLDHAMLLAMSMFLACLVVAAVSQLTRRYAAKGVLAPRWNRLSVGDLLGAMLLTCIGAAFFRTLLWSNLLIHEIRLPAIVSAILLAIALAFAAVAPRGWLRQTLLVWFPLVSAVGTLRLQQAGFDAWLMDLGFPMGMVSQSVQYSAQLLAICAWVYAITPQPQCRVSAVRAASADAAEEPPIDEPDPPTLPMRLDVVV